MSQRPILKLRLTEQQEVAATTAGRLANTANLLLGIGKITPEQHRAVMRKLAPMVQPVIDAMTSVERNP